jgi:uncharacterized membrane protein
MAGQKPAGRGRTSGPTQGSSGRQGGTRQGGQGAGNRQNQGRPRPGAASTTKGNGAASGSAKARPTETAVTRARSASATSAAKPGSASQAASPAAGPLGKIFGAFRRVGFVPLATWVLSLYALGASIYLTIAHYDSNVTLVCSDKGLVNCAEVTTSPQSMVFGVLPVAVLGLAYYVFMTALNSPWVWRLQQTGSEQISKILRYTRLGAVITGMGFVLYLIYAELIQIKAICLWCTSVHVATFLIFALIVFYTTFNAGTSGPASQGQAGRQRRA